MKNEQKNGYSKQMWRRTVSLLLASLLFAFQWAGSAGAEEAADSRAAAAKETAAEWIFTDKGTDGVFPATGGMYKTSSTLRDVGTNTDQYTYEPGERSIRNQGWNDGTGKKYWLATLSTKGFENLTLSSQQTSSSTGPRDFKVQFSTDQSNWTDLPGGNLVLEQTNFNCKNNSCKLVDAPLPSQANDNDLLYIRWVVNSTKSVSGGTVSSSGSSRIKDVIVTGDRKTGGPTPTLSVQQAPANGASDVTPNAAVSVKFNKAIALNSGPGVSIVDQNNTSLGNLSVGVVNSDTLAINHPNFTDGKTYTVTVPKELVRGAADNVPLTSPIVWSFTTRGASAAGAPTLLNMTFNGDTKTSISFDWYTGTDVTGTVVQVVEASKAPGGSFPEQEAITFTGTTEIIKTLMKSSDRSSNKTTSFANHKVTANNLKPGTKYKYRAGSGRADSWSPVGSFTTDHANNHDFHFIYTTDTQGSSKGNFELWQDTFRRAIDHIGDPKFMLLTGDLIDDGDLEEQWQWFLGIPQKEFANVPFAPIVGNHEIEDHPNNNFYYHFNLPKSVGTSTEDGTVYSFEYGDALFMQINTQYEGQVDPYKADAGFKAQVDWMRSQVAKTDKKWKIVTMHKGAYSSGDNADAESERVEFYRKYLIPVFDELGIDMVLEGHDHLYMRSHQMLGNKAIKDVVVDGQGNVVNPKGSVYLMGNSAAAKFYKINPNIKDFFSVKNAQPNKKMFVDVQVTDGILKFTSYTAAKNEPLAVYDQYSIKRTDGKPSKVENAKGELKNRSAVISWNAPASTSEPVRGYRIYEKNDKTGTNWSVYVPAVNGQGTYQYTVNNADPSKTYDFVIKAVGARSNSDPMEASTSTNP